MKKFQDIEYKRPDLDQLKSEFATILEDFVQAESGEKQLELIRQMDTLKNNFLTEYSIAYIRHTVNTKDEFYDREIEFFNENMPVYEELIDRFNQAVLKSDFKPEI
ncbi:MAG: M3 family oligoendopeptidase, partial [Clostridiaceae bacterium]|nr:M3 family oligoendopeptidase [Clostridiaceae bacterium]